MTMTPLLDNQDDHDWFSKQRIRTTTATTTSLSPQHKQQHKQQQRAPLMMNRHKFHTQMSLALTVVTLVGLIALSLLFGGEHSIDNNNNNYQDNNNMATTFRRQQYQQQYQQHYQQHYQQQQQRWLEDAGGHNNQDDDDDDDSNNNTIHDDDDDDDYSSYSCNNLYSVTPNRGKAQCQYARTCNQGEGVWLPLVFCLHNDETTTTTTTWLSFEVILGLLTPFMLLWLILLFRLLGSTAEDYFSPALEMMSVKLGLPPRFAGVSLLALGNGAADVSATISAITTDPDHGYLLSLGALTGAGMVISSVVSALVVLTAGGVPCRGALVRDVVALGVAVLIVWYQLGGGSAGAGGGSSGVVGPDTVTLFLSLYILFVLLVLCADIYHRAVVLPRRQQRSQEAERQRQLDEQRLHELQVNNLENNNNNNNNNNTGSGGVTGTGTTTTNTNTTTTAVATGDAASQSQVLPMTTGNITTTTTTPPPTSGRSAVRFSTVLTAFSNYDNDDDRMQSQWRRGGGGGGVDSEELTMDQPMMLHGSHGILGTHQHRTGGVVGELLGSRSSSSLSQSHAVPGGTTTTTTGGGRGIGEESQPLPSTTTTGGGGGGMGEPQTSYTMLNDTTASGATAMNQPSSLAGGPPPVDEYMSSSAMLLATITTTSVPRFSTSWYDAWQSSWLELKQHADQVWDDICYDGDLDMITKILLLLELPFMMARKLTVPIPCEGFYVRGLIALSTALSPLWMALYVYLTHDVMLLFGGGSGSIGSGGIFFWMYWIVSILIALAFLRWAPGGTEGSDILSLWISTPLALYGFVMAATWIDTIANSLVSLLDFVGIVLHIPGPIVGLTILAWGNSMSDLSANITMARKGLANMAMTACFAGPFFNILVGLGLGFSSLTAQTGQTERIVHVEPSISVGFIFLALNSVVFLLTGFVLRGTTTTTTTTTTSNTPSTLMTSATATTNTTSTAVDYGNNNVGGGRIPKKYGYIAVRTKHLTTIYIYIYIYSKYTHLSGGHYESLIY